MIAALLLAAMLTARFLPESAFGTWLNRVAMTPLAERIGRIERRHLIFAVAVALIVVFAGEVLAMAGPLDAGLVFVWDVSIYLDIAVTALTLAATARGAGAWRVVKSFLAARPHRTPVSRARRARRSPAARLPANDDEGHRAGRLAA